MRQGLRLVLERQPDLEVVGEAANASEAMAIAAGLDMDLVVMDYCLPGADGIAISRQLLTATPSIRIIILSAEIAPAIVNEALAAGVAGYVSKENAADELVRAVRAVLSGRIFLCPETTTVMFRQRVVSPVPILPAFSERDRSLLRLIAEGLRNKEIAAELNLSPKSIESYRSILMKRLGYSSPAELVRFAVREGFAKL